MKLLITRDLTADAENALQVLRLHHRDGRIEGLIHEHFRAYNLGKTTCINTEVGSSANIRLQIMNERIKKLKLYRADKF